jgi:hypothetical protein
MSPVRVLWVTWWLYCALFFGLFGFFAFHAGWWLMLGSLAAVFVPVGVPRGPDR